MLPLKGAVYTLLTFDHWRFMGRQGVSRGWWVEGVEWGSCAVIARWRESPTRGRDWGCSEEKVRGERPGKYRPLKGASREVYHVGE